MSGSPPGAHRHPGGGAGIRQFVVGIGGRGLAGFGAALPTSQMRDSATFRGLALALHPDGHDGRFDPAAGKGFIDAGSGRCH